METVKSKRRTKKKQRSLRQQCKELRKNKQVIPEAHARLKHLRVAPRKARLIADMIRGRDVETATNVLNFSDKKAAQPMLNLLKSVVANAKQDSEKRDESLLYIQKIWVDGGRTVHRFRPRAMGRASRIRKTMCHITIILKEKE